MLVREFPQIKAIASIYFEGDVEYTQEFEVAEDGIIETPRVISGCVIDPFMEISALSDKSSLCKFPFPASGRCFRRGPGRGLRLGSDAWPFGRIYGVALYGCSGSPQFDGDEMAGAVQRYYYLDVEQQITEDEIILELSNFQDEGYLLLRINEESQRSRKRLPAAERLRLWETDCIW